MSLIEKTEKAAKAYNALKDAAMGSTESQVDEAERFLQTQGLSKDFEIMFMRIRKDFNAKTIKELKENLDREKRLNIEVGAATVK